MPRIARKKSGSGYYHVVFRGINKQNIFYDNEDREVLLNRLKLLKKEIKCELLAFCLMDNHVHLLVKEEEVAVGEIMRKLLSSYVFWYNSKYERVGNLFQDRFKSEPIENDSHMLCCVRYILQNPVKANLCKSIWEYRWSSANLLIKDKKTFIDSDMVKGMFQTDDDLASFMEVEAEEKFLEWEGKIKLTDEILKERIEKIINNESMYKILQKDKDQRDDILKKIMRINGTNILQISRVTGIPYHMLRYAK